MKRIISLLLATLMLMTAFAMIAYAENTETAAYDFTVDGVEYTVNFTNSQLSPEKQEAIARILVGLDEPAAQPYGLGCILFGHDYLYETTTLTSHQLVPTAPRCLRNTYEVTTCEDCDYFDKQIIRSEYIYCCPED